MSKKFSAARKRAFLRFLAESGNQTLSAERAKVSRSWVTLHRSTDAEFDAECREAIAAARERLLGPPHPPTAGAVGPSLSLGGRGAKWSYHDGVELVVRGTGGAGGGKRVQIGRARLKQWTPRQEDRFLALLAGSCNVKAACREMGVAFSSAYAHRNRWPGFARRWDQAIETGYVQIEASLVEAGGQNPFSNPEEMPMAEMPTMTIDQKIHLLHMHKHEVRALGKAPGLQPRIATEAEVEKALAKAVKRAESWAKREAMKGKRK